MVAARARRRLKIDTQRCLEVSGEGDWCATKSYWYDESAIGLSQLIRGFLNWHASILLYLLSWMWAALHCSAMYERDRLDLDEFFLFLPASPTRELDEARK